MTLEESLRNQRWDKAFSEETNSPTNVHRKATIVIEHVVRNARYPCILVPSHIFVLWFIRFKRRM